MPRFASIPSTVGCATDAAGELTATAQAFVSALLWQKSGLYSTRER
jgi:hypothetical protein